MILFTSGTSEHGVKALNDFDPLVLLNKSSDTFDEIAGHLPLKRKEISSSNSNNNAQDESPGYYLQCIDNS